MMHIFHKDKFFNPKKISLIALYIHSFLNTVKIKTKIQTETVHLSWICPFLSYQQWKNKQLE